eukprot:977651-Amphidinium_carterae.1
MDQKSAFPIEEVGNACPLPSGSVLNFGSVCLVFSHDCSLCAIWDQLLTTLLGHATLSYSVVLSCERFDWPIVSLLMPQWKPGGHLFCLTLDLHHELNSTSSVVLLDDYTS